MLLHGFRGVGDTELARADASAAALALESIRIEALVQQRAHDVRWSPARLVTVDDTQRQALAERLAAGPIARPRRIRRSGTGPEIGQIIDDLDRLAYGLNPAGLADGRRCGRRFENSPTERTFRTRRPGREPRPVARRRRRARLLRDVGV